MKTIVLTILSLALVATSSPAQPDVIWNQVFDTEASDDAYDAVFTPDSCIVTVGTHYIHNSSAPYIADIGLRKINRWGVEEWYHTLDIDQLDRAYSIETTEDGGFIIFGCTGVTNTGYGVLLLKTNAEGEEEWHSIFAEPGKWLIPRWGVQSPDGGYLIVGLTTPVNSSDSQWDGLVMKIGADLEMQWCNSFGGDYQDVLNKVIPTSDGGCLVAGGIYLEEPETQYQAWLMKLDQDGEQVWETRFGDEDDQVAEGLLETETGSFIVCGFSGEVANNYFDGVLDGFLAEISPEGDSLSFETLDPLDDESTYLHSIIPTYNTETPAIQTGYCVYGYSQSQVYQYSTSDLLLIGVDLELQETWHLELGSAEDEWSYAGITEAWDNGCVVTGQANCASLQGQAVTVYYLDGPALTGVGEPPASLPGGFSLSKAWPNPFNPTATVMVSLPVASEVRVELLNVLGQRVALVGDGIKPGGQHRYLIDGSSLTSGTYFVRAQIPGRLDVTRKVQLLK